MATTNKWMSYDNLKKYDPKIKAVIADGDTSTLESAKDYTDEKLATLTSGSTTVAKATEATHATSADTATNATNATKAEEATHAVNADNATNATHATSADTATTAISATNATNATNATKATQDASGNVITTTYETKSDASAKLTEAKSYADTQIATAVDGIMGEGAKEALDTIGELSAALTDNQDMITTLNSAITSKADKDHTHTVSDITDYVAPVQSDWNQNDETALDYVKNRPFYETEPVLTEFIPETTVTEYEDWSEEDCPIYAGSICPANIELKIGQTYDVTYDGVLYEDLVCFSDYDTHIVGAHYDDFYNDSMEYPFSIYIDSYYNEYWINCKDNSNHTIKVTGMISEVIQLDRKYIAEHLDSIPGKKVEGQTFTIDGEEIVAEYGAEVFNDYDVNIATGNSSHAEGSMTIASGHYSHAEGWHTTASSESSHAEGYATTASGESSHAEGSYTTASGWASHAEGTQTKASSHQQHVQGKNNIEDTAEIYAHIVGNGIIDGPPSNAHTLDWNGNAWFQGDVYVGSTSGTNKDEGSKRLVTEDGLDWDKLQNRPFYTADPVLTEIIPQTTFTGTSKVIDSNISSLTIGETYTVVWDGTTYDNLVCKNVSGLAAIGASDFTFTDYPFLIGIDNGNCNLMASTNASHTVKVTGMVSEVIPLDRKYIAEYLDTLPVYAGQKVPGVVGAEIFNNYSSNTASSAYAHAEGSGTTASGTVSHAEGYETVAEGGYSHAQGYKTQATGNRAHAEGQGSVASGDESHAEGTYTIAAGDSQHVQGKYNVEDTAGTYAHIVGNGSNVNNRKNAHTLDWDGNAWFAGSVEGNALIMADTATGTKYKIQITNGKLTMTEVTE